VYTDVFLPLNGRHQGDNAALALTAVEAFFAAPVNEEIVTEAFADVVIPGRFEVLNHLPLVIVDGAHNPAGADVCAEVFFEDFHPEGERVLVVGCLRGRDPSELLGALRADEFDTVYCCTAPSARGLPAADLAAVARSIGCDDVREAATVAEACDRALNGAGVDDAILVTGSLYVVGAARPLMIRRRMA
jgi:dihydrofolate synthase/folylpolyglutamate synthase